MNRSQTVSLAAKIRYIRLTSASPTPTSFASEIARTANLMVSRGTVLRWESQLSFPRLPYLIAIATIGSVSLDSLLAPAILPEKDSRIQTELSQRSVPQLTINLGAKIQQLRNFPAQRSISEFARDLSTQFDVPIDQSKLSNWEHDLHQPKANALYALAHSANITVDDLLIRTYPMHLTANYTNDPTALFRFETRQQAEDTIGHKIRVIRRDFFGISQRRFAELLEATGRTPTASSIHYWETNQTTPQRPKLLAISQLANISYNDLVDPHRIMRLRFLQSEQVRQLPQYRQLIGLKLKTLRREILGLSIDRLAQLTTPTLLIPISTNQIRNWENGVSLPPVAVIVAIAKLANMAPTLLVAPDQASLTTLKRQPLPVSRHDWQLTKAYHDELIPLINHAEETNNHRILAKAIAVFKTESN